MAKNKIINPYACPLCGQNMEIVCRGFENEPFIDGKKYKVLCFTCINVPKIWETTYGKAKDGSEDKWEGPFFTHKKLKTAEEMLEDGSVNDIRIAKKSILEIKRSIKKMRKKLTD